MTKLAVSIMVTSLPQALAASAQAAQMGADLIEFRIDQFTDQMGQIAILIEKSELPCILTCRLAREGGGYNGDEPTRVELFERATSGMRLPAYLDVEWGAYQNSNLFRQRIDQLVDHRDQDQPTTTGLILSSHDFENRPLDLSERIKAMAATPACSVIKIVWQARSLRDNLEAFEIISQHNKPTIVLCMGEAGLPSRVLAKKFGSLLTFAALEEDTATASGQPTITELKEIYRWDAISPQTQVFGVIGYPVAHSMSPLIHNAGFTHINFDGIYLPMPISPEYEHFKATIGAWLDMADLHFTGASVTIPHKENLLRFVRERGGQIDPLAERIGAANTLTRHNDGRLEAVNTDCAAATEAVCNGMGIGHDGLKNQRVSVVGAGGVARAVVAGFAHYGATVVIYNRTFERAKALADHFQNMAGKVVAARLEKLRNSCGNIFINCTSVGMSPNVDATPIPSEMMLGKRRGSGTVIFDTVYNPIQTRLLTEARSAGCVTIPGTEMFVRQAAAQFQLWTAQDAPLGLFRQVLADRLNG